MSEESVVLVGGRRNLPQIFVEHENSGQLRFRREGSVASEGSGCAGGVTSTPTNYGIPGSYSTNFHLPMPEGKTASTPPPGFGKHQLDQGSADSGYSGWGDTVRKQRPQTSSHSRNSFRADGSGDSSFWSIISSPVSDFTKKFKGRQSFVDEGPHFNLKIQPQHILAGIVGTVLLASVGFSLLIGFQHFNLNEKLNGKHRSIQYGTVKRAENLKKEIGLSEDDITDEAGNMLGGKRAAMQFAHNKVKREAGGDSGNAESGGSSKIAEGAEKSGDAKTRGKKTTGGAKTASGAETTGGAKAASGGESTGSSKIAGGAKHNASVNTAAKVEVSEPLALPEDPQVEIEDVVEDSKPLESLSILELTERMKELNLRLMETNRDGVGISATKIINQIDALKARKRYLLGRLQEAEKNSRARRVAKSIVLEDDDDDDKDDDEDDYEERSDNAVQDAEVQERLEKLSRYEKAVAQINELSDQLSAAAASKSGGKVAVASKTDGTGRAASKTTSVAGQTSSNAGDGKAGQKSKAESIKNRPKSPKVPDGKNAVNPETSATEKPRQRAPKTRLTNPLTGSITVPPMSRAKKAAQEAKSAEAGGRSSEALQRGSAPAADLKAELQEMQQRLKYLKEAVEDEDLVKDIKEDEEAKDEDESDEEFPEYPDQPTFRRLSSRSSRPASRGSSRSKRRDKTEDEKFRKKARPSGRD